MSAASSSADFGSITIFVFGFSRTVSVPLADKLFWQFLKEDIVPACKGWTSKFGKYETAHMNIHAGDIIFNTATRFKRVIECIPKDTKFICVMWLGVGAMNWRIEWIGNACDVTFPDRPDDCAICLESLTKVEGRRPWLLECCGHLFHKECVAKANELCPLCRGRRTVTDLHWAKI
jgi:hypothetical protein